MLIGKKVTVVGGTNKSLIGLSGVVVDETKNMLELETVSGLKRLIKSQVTLSVSIGRKRVKVIGKDVVGRFVERLKR